MSAGSEDAHPESRCALGMINDYTKKNARDEKNPWLLRTDGPSESQYAGDRNDT
ncbi:MAG: hypothetical protein N3B12_03595 [Armatimonadetes bacterium]|nr:hypothetical protein [Armatimonadota bacterium]